MKSSTCSPRFPATAWTQNTTLRAKATSATRKRTSRKPEICSATTPGWTSRKAYAALSSGTRPRSKQKPRRRQLKHKCQPRPPRPQNNSVLWRTLPPILDGSKNQLLRSNGFAVAQRLARFRYVVVPEPQRLQLFLLRPNLVQRVALEQFAILHHPMNGVRVVNVVE